MPWTDKLRTPVRPWILKLGSIPGMSPPVVGVVSATLLLPPTLLAGSPLMTPLLTAYALAITLYLVDRQEAELNRLEPLLVKEGIVADVFRRRLSRHPRGLIWPGWLVGPLAMVGVNWSGPRLSALRAGEPLTWGGAWGLAAAALFWVILFQMLMVFFRNAWLFHRLGARHVRIDLLDVSSLTPFARVAIRNLLIFMGGFVLAPLALLQGSQFLIPLLLSLVPVVPSCVALVAIPIWAVHLRLTEEKEAELVRIGRALRGREGALRDSPIAEDAGEMTLTNLVLYRRMIDDVSEWPVDSPILLRFAGYVVIPILAWVGAALVERWVDSFL